MKSAKDVFLWLAVFSVSAVILSIFGVTSLSKGLSSALFIVFSVYVVARLIDLSNRAESYFLGILKNKKTAFLASFLVFLFMVFLFLLAMIFTTKFISDF